MCMYVLRMHLFAVHLVVPMCSGDLFVVGCVFETLHAGCTAAWIRSVVRCEGLRICVLRSLEFAAIRFIHPLHLIGLVVSWICG